MCSRHIKRSQTTADPRNDTHRWVFSWRTATAVSVIVLSARLPEEVNTTTVLLLYVLLFTAVVCGVNIMITHPIMYQGIHTTRI